MQRNRPIQILLRLVLISFLTITSGCASSYLADADADQLVAAMQELPNVQSHLASVRFYPDLNKLSGGSIAENADSRNLKEITYNEKDMLNLAAHASIFRWFQDKVDEEDLPSLNIHARIFKLEHLIKIDAGRMQPVAKAKLEVYLTDNDKNRIYESYFTTHATGPKGDLFRNKRETQEAYGYTIYKALVLAFESAFADISEKLNLKPTWFDIDEIKIDKAIASNTKT